MVRQVLLSARVPWQTGRANELAQVLDVRGVCVCVTPHVAHIHQKGYQGSTVHISSEKQGKQQARLD